ncbi:MAG: hypothetical protein KDN19_22035 [Verrucomicrobiae bacterium]|nr:hypothetical protein [Verrucomicrobiae bacterium]
MLPPVRIDRLTCILLRAPGVAMAAIWALSISMASAQLPPFAVGDDTDELDRQLPQKVPSDLIEPQVTARTGSADRFARIFSAELRDIEERQAEILAELETLPPLQQVVQPELFGYHSGPAKRRPKWVQIDLGEHVKPDAVALFPVTVQLENQKVVGYGFPSRFRIDISDDPNFSDYQYETIVDHRSTSKLMPKEAPFYHEGGGLGGRYIRMTPISLWKPDPSLTANLETGQEEPEEVFALAEMMVIKGERNIAIGKPVSALDWDELSNFWARRYLTDGRTPLGVPSGLEPSPTLGYRCDSEKATSRWVQIDLEESVPISEIRMIPANPPNVVPNPNLEFPSMFKIEISDSPDMRQADTVVKINNGQLAKPGNNPVIFPVDSGYGRYVRLTVERRNAGPLSFALAELQVFSDNHNASQGKTVTAEESVEEDNWSRDALVDGFGSRNNLEGFPEWLSALSRRADLIREWREKEQQRLDLVETTVSRGIRYIGSGAGALMLLIIMGLARGRSRRRRDLESLRQQIASDLHDDIGSNLSSIALLAELGSSESEEPELVREEFDEIKRTADKTVESMRDIVWLIRPGEETWKQMIARFRETAAKLLRAHEYRFETKGTMHEERLPLDFKRDLFLMYKEILNNIVRHAEAQRVQIELETQRGRLLLRIADDGKGFNNLDQNFREGNGLKNLRRRAQALGGNLKVRSAAGEGTSIQLTAPIP